MTSTAQVTRSTPNAPRNNPSLSRNIDGLIDIVDGPIFVNALDSRFGIRGDGITDDTLAIEAAMSYISSNGGGKLYFPYGTYKINASQHSKGGIQALGKVVLEGQHEQGTILKLADNSQPNTGANSIFWWDDVANTDLGGFGIRRLTVDQNAPNQPVPSVTPSRPHFICNFGNATLPVFFREVSFLNINGVNSLYLSGNTSLYEVDRCRFVVNPNVAATHFDCSVIYWFSVQNGYYSSFRATRNRFEGTTGAAIGWNGAAIVPGWVGAGACIETHGQNQILAHNFASNMGGFFNLSGIAANASTCISCLQNEGSNVGYFANLYSQPYSGGTASLSGLDVSHNQATIETDAFGTAVSRGDGLSFAKGIVLTQQLICDNLEVTYNILNFNPYHTVGLAGDSSGVGINLQSPDNPFLNRCSNWNVIGNEITGCMGSGTIIQAWVRGLNVLDNTYRNVAMLGATMTAGYRVGVLCSARGEVMSINNNKAFDEQIAPTLLYGVSNLDFHPGVNTITDLEMLNNQAWSAAAPHPRTVFIDTTANRAPYHNNRTHNYAAPAGDSVYHSKIIDLDAGVEYQQTAAPVGAVWAAV